MRVPGVALILLLAGGLCHAAAEARPNVLFIAIGDSSMGAGEIFHRDDDAAWSEREVRDGWQMTGHASTIRRERLL